MTAPENQPPDKKSGRRTAYMLHLKQQERAEYRERIRSMLIGWLVLAGLAGTIYFILSVTTGSSKPTPRPTTPPRTSGR